MYLFIFGHIIYVMAFPSKKIVNVSKQPEVHTLIKQTEVHIFTCMNNFELL